MVIEATSAVTLGSTVTVVGFACLALAYGRRVVRRVRPGRPGTAGLLAGGRGRTRPTSYAVPDRRRRGLTGAADACTAEEVRFASRDPALAGRRSQHGGSRPTTANPPTRPAVVLVHGIQSCRREANVLLPAAMLHRAGFSVFLMDLRDHGDSDGDDGRFAGGSEEYLDVLGGWDWVADRAWRGERIGLLGLSFGAVNAIIAGAQEPGVASRLGGLRARPDGRGDRPVRREPASRPDRAVEAARPRGRSCGRGSSPATTSSRSIRSRQIDAYGGRSDRVRPRRGRRCPPRERSRPSSTTGRSRPAPRPPTRGSCPGAGHTEAVYVEPDGYAAATRRVLHARP